MKLKLASFAASLLCVTLPFNAQADLSMSQNLISQDQISNQNLTAIDQNYRCAYNLTSEKFEQRGTAKVEIQGQKLRVKLLDAEPNTLYTVWVDFRSMTNNNALPTQFPSKKQARHLAPAFATNEGVLNGMGLDKNAIVTDVDGDAILEINLDYSPLQADRAPIVSKSVAMQGKNIVAGSWMKKFSNDTKVQASTPMIDQTTGMPELVRSTAAGFTVLRHVEKITHGVVPGTPSVDYVKRAGFRGDIPTQCAQEALQQEMTPSQHQQMQQQS